MVLVLIVLAISIMNYLFAYLGYCAGKKIRIIEIKESESIEYKEPEKPEGIVKEALDYLKKEKNSNSYDSYSEESAYVVTPEEEMRIDNYLRSIRNGEA